ncbi:Elongation factor P [bioreactor metagenome]|uniref:Elongation factor P n=1 Tax=bioreactor metagenome TaxID=1076179 RepID=A0A645EDI9_9ZZZZ
MISTNDLRTGVTVEIDGAVWSVLEFQHVKPGKGAAFVRTKMKNVATGAVQERTFNAGEKLNKARIENKEMQYLYASGDFYTFMDNSTFEQMDLTSEQIGDGLKYLIENMNIFIQVFDGKIIGIEMPNFVELTITECEPGVKGDTATGGTKPATLQTGAQVKVPFFINEGDKIRIDTRTGEYLSRV